MTGRILCVPQAAAPGSLPTNRVPINPRSRPLTEEFPMTPSSRRPSRVLVVCGVLCLVAVTPMSRSTSATPRFVKSCVVLKQWARVYANRSMTLDEFAQFDRPHRIAIFNAITPALRSSLVQDQLRRYVVRPELSDTQRTFVREALTLTTPTLYSGDPAAKKAYEAFWARAKDSFVPFDHARLGFEIGAIRSTAVRSGAQLPDCECAEFHPWPQCVGQWCVSANCLEWWGCGPSGAYTCDGFCESSQKSNRIPS
jgi:hypothetical protein